MDSSPSSTFSLCAESPERVQAKCPAQCLAHSGALPVPALFHAQSSPFMLEAEACLSSPSPSTPVHPKEPPSGCSASLASWDLSYSPDLTVPCGPAGTWHLIQGGFAHSYLPLFNPPKGQYTPALRSPPRRAGPELAVWLLAAAGWA